MLDRVDRALWTMKPSPQKSGENTLYMNHSTNVFDNQIPTPSNINSNTCLSKRVQRNVRECKPSLRDEEQLLLPGGRGSVVSNRDVQLQVGAEQFTSNRDVDVQVETEPVSKTDVTVQTDEDTEIEYLRLKNEIMAKELANKQALIEGQENQLATCYQSILELKAELKMAQEKNDAHMQMQSEQMGEKEALKRELEGKVTLIEENKAKMFQLDEELKMAWQKNDAHIQMQSELIGEKEALKRELEGKVTLIEENTAKMFQLNEELKMAHQKNDAHIQMQSELIGEKEALKRELEGKVTLIEENTVKMVQLNEELENAKKEIEAHDELKSILLAENEDLKKSNEERSFLNEELALAKIKLEKELVEARSNDQKRSQGHQRLVKELQGEISKSLVQNRELKEALFTITKKNEGLREQLENKGKRDKNLNGKVTPARSVGTVGEIWESAQEEIQEGFFALWGLLQR
ncbi:protein Hook homolog 3-like [Palaemon carinicauda]|uniref:protein Hook homolog 3-like n=1 Tax=Palaemon carinicauda TaxID=392227 RepID=UPI0035B65939